jgi:hypothetical protein
MTESFDKLKAQKQRIETRAAGAVIERSLVKRWARRQLTEYAQQSDVHNEGAREVLEDLISWLNEQPKRTKRKGGIGR